MTCDTLIIGYDKGVEGGDTSAISIVRKKGLHKLELVNLFTGKDADELYFKLVGGTTEEERRVLFGL